MINNNRFYKGPSSSEKKIQAKRALEKLESYACDIQPVILNGRSLASTWWGKAWNMNLESYADYENRIARGKNYLRNNSVLDLKILRGKVVSKVQGSKVRPYTVTISIDTLSNTKWEEVIALCNERIDSLEHLINGSFPKELEVIFKDKKYGMFPSPNEIHFDCSCPDWADMCKHVAATLYGIGQRLDANPMLFFELRDIDGQLLVKKSIERKVENMLKNAGKKSQRTISDEDIKKIFGI